MSRSDSENRADAVPEIAHTPTRRIESCRRCGEKHEAVELHPFARPIPDVDGDFTDWATCPTTGDPILVRNAAEGQLMPTGRIVLWATRLEGDKWENLTGAELAAFLREPHTSAAAYAGGDSQPHDWEAVFVDESPS